MLRKWNYNGPKQLLQTSICAENDGGGGGFRLHNCSVHLSIQTHPKTS